MKISVIAPYYERQQQLRNTLDSFHYWYDEIANDFEIIVLDDGSPTAVAGEILAESGFPNVVYKYIERDTSERGNPAALHNRGALVARAPLLFLTNPENMHLGPVLLDAIENTMPNTYRCYACRAVKCVPFEDVLRDPIGHLADDAFVREQQAGWLQHSSHANRLIYFGAAISKPTYERCGGIDEAFTGGYGWEDLDAILRWRKQGVRCQAIDEPCVAHQEHPKFLDQPGYDRNAGIFLERHHQWEGIFDPTCAEDMQCSRGR